MIVVDKNKAKQCDATIILQNNKNTHSLLAKKLDKGEIFPVLSKSSFFLFLGIGDSSTLSGTELRILIRKAFQSGYLKQYQQIAIIPHEDKIDVVTAIIEGYLIGTYTWDKYKADAKKEASSKNKTIIIDAKQHASYQQIITIAEGANLTRNLVNDNADVVVSDYLEATVKSLVKGKKNISLEILNEKQLKAKGLNLHLAVNQGSLKEPKLIIVKYQGAPANAKYTAIVGKGMTFDTGGLNLKPTGSIETMKIDMAGASAVIGVLKNTLALGLKKNILFVLGIAENAIGPGAYKPGDVFVGLAGKSVEIGNTDAEGRLVLADAFAYISKNYKPEVMIDLATLTGACVVALGFDYTGLFSNDDKLANALLSSAATTDDRAWRLPIYPEMNDYIKSPIADLKNTSSVKGAGASTAATFLHQFVGEGIRWAHLDIAGTSFVDGANRFYFNHGATGSGVRLVTNYLLNN